MTKRATVVGINDYSIQGFNNLSYCVRDAQAMYHVLVDAFGFDPSQIWYYADRDASSENIRRALNYMLSISEPGDVACFYYAGHGGLHPVGTNTYYETIIPASGRFITDYDLRQAADQLQPSWVNFTVILDSCHSGGMHDESETAATIRSVQYDASMIQRIVESMRTCIPCGVCVPDPSAFTNNVSNVRSSGDGLVCADEDPNQVFIQQAKSTMIGACRWDQTAGEDPKFGHGYLTEAFLEIVNASNFQIDHRSLVTQLEAKVGGFSSSTQIPQLRGQQNRMEESFLQGWSDSR
jgi:hypothetical protein